MSKRNENRPGYKKTPIGWIPQEWGCEQLKEICKKSGEYGVNAPSVPYCKKSPRFIRITDISEDGQLLEDKKRGLDSKLAEGLLLNHGDFLFARTGATVGKSYLHKDDGNQYAFAGYLIRFVLNQKEILGEYLRAYTSTKFYWRWVILMTRSGAQPNINAKEYSSLQIPLPPIQEQNKILEILTNWNNVIDLIKKLIAAKQHLKIGLMQQLLTGRYRFPKFKYSKMSEKKAFVLPSKWEYKHLGEIAHETVTRNGNKSDLPVVSCTKFEGFVNSMDYFGKKVFGDDVSNYKIINRNQFGFPANHVEEGSIGLLNHQETAIVSPIYVVFEVDTSRVYPAYLYSLLKTKTSKQIFKTTTNASVNRRGSLRWRAFSKIKILLPPIEEQIYIENFKKHLDNEIGYLQKELKYFQLQKKELTQKLLTGEVRHPDFIKKRITKEE